MKTSRRLSSAFPLSRDLLDRKVADALSREIISGRIPDGTHLVEQDLAEMYGVSRAPVRAALSILERERLVVSVPGKGSFVRSLSEDSIRGLFAVRRLLEGYAAELAAQHIAANPQKAGDLEALVDRFAKAVEQGRIEEYAEFDLDIHRAVWELTGNDHLADLLKQLSTISHAILGLHAEISEDWASGAPVTHREMVEAIATGDPQVAGQVVREQLVEAEDGALEALKTIRAAANVTV